MILLSEAVLRIGTSPYFCCTLFSIIHIVQEYQREKYAFFFQDHTHTCVLLYWLGVRKGREKTKRGVNIRLFLAFGIFFSLLEKEIGRAKLCKII